MTEIEVFVYFVGGTLAVVTACDIPLSGLVKNVLDPEVTEERTP